jgi:hypothetical protein
MTNQHPITPPSGLVDKWSEEWHRSEDDNTSFEAWMLARAAQWGADQELEACEQAILDRKWFADPEFRLAELHNARRPKPQTLNSIALEMLGTIEKMDVVVPEITDTIRRALKELPE